MKKDELLNVVNTVMSFGKKEKLTHCRTIEVYEYSLNNAYYEICFDNNKLVKVTEWINRDMNEIYLKDCE